MRLRAEQLDGALARGVAPVYAVSGDEALLVDEAAAAIRRALYKQGVDARQSFQADTGFNWQDWLAGFDALSLFASRQLVELRLPTGKPGVEGGKALEAWCANPPADTWLLLHLPRLDRAGQGSKWFTALDKAGVVVTATPPGLEQLPDWIGARLRAKGLNADRETKLFLAGRVEGNLLAADQEVEKLALLLPPGPIGLEDVRGAVLDVARYDTGQLPEALLKGEAVRFVRILDGLRGEGEAPPLPLWVLTQEIRTLYRVALAVRQGQSAASAMADLRIWDSKQPLIGRALRRLDLDTLGRALQLAARIDRVAKGLGGDDPWLLMKQLGLGLMGKPAPELEPTTP
ncbi:MAG TPA: DNA polymerase III subunit delta [Thiobacillaceae bacterium]|nr:DNA polymerase III subunit delta [Thiobacillaceae bacterium]